MVDQKVALITGASSGIGRACSIKFAREGYIIVINYLHNKNGAEETARLIKEDCDGESIVIQANVMDEKQVIDMINTVERQYGRIDVLVNNAGVFNAGYFLREKNDNIDRLVDINIKGTMYVAKNVLKIMMMQKKGKIVNVSSLSSKVGLVGQTIYSMTKGAVNSFTRSFAKEAICYGVNVNAVAPGYIETRITEGLSEVEYKKSLESIPVKRFGKASEVADLVYFLSSDNSDYIVGQIISIDGGYSV